jgi:hypothetical protein
VPDEQLNKNFTKKVSRKEVSDNEKAKVSSALSQV